MRLIPTALIAGCAILAVAEPATAAPIDAVFPRARQVCYVAKAKPGSVRAIGMLRLTRPVRLHQHDTNSARAVRIVINFSGEGTPRLEDTVLCKGARGALTCQSTTCEGTGFTLRQDERGRLTIHQEAASPDVVWSCEEDAIRAIILTEEERALDLATGSGSCLN